MNRGFTLIELVIAIGLLAFIMTGFWFATLALERRMRSDTDEAILRVQLHNAMENVRLHCISASKIEAGSLFPAGKDSQKATLHFRGQRDVYTVTPSVLTDDTWYLYSKDAEGNLVLREVSESGRPLSEEVLVESRYEPELWFRYKSGFEPNFLEATISGNVVRGGVTGKVSRKLGVRFWFVGVLAV
jgi:prepilin-type N-terminal cleavage/methylation domain-containing protein